jgi:hypothetical protein
MGVILDFWVKKIYIKVRNLDGFRYLKGCKKKVWLKRWFWGLRGKSNFGGHLELSSHFNFGA